MSGDYLDPKSICNSPNVFKDAYAASEWDELNEDGKAWVAAIVQETERRIRLAPLTDALATSLLSPKLCDLLPSINKGPVKTRFCQTCGKLYRPPYTCPLSAYRGKESEI